jgi:SAM-dependent methyltransferase
MTPDGGDDFERDLDAIKRHYSERFLPASPWASLINTHPYLCQRQRHRRLREALIACGARTPEALGALDVLDVGCGAGGNLAWLVELGADASRMIGVDLLEARIAVARSRFAGIQFIAGDFVKTDVGGPFDLVLMLTVLSSVTNPDLRRRIMAKALSLLKPGGIFFFHDLVTRKQLAGNADFRCLTFAELDGYVAPRKLRYFRKDFLRGSMAERIVPRFGVTVAELVQATGLFNIDSTFAYCRG